MDKIMNLFLSLS